MMIFFGMGIIQEVEELIINQRTFIIKDLVYKEYDLRSIPQQ